MILHMKLQLAGTPLGNPKDASIRLIEAIKAADVIAAEDSRRFQRLCQDLEISTNAKVFSFFEGNESGRTSELIDLLNRDLTVLVVTDAGMPTVSDPGFKLVRAAINEGIQVEVIPGPSAVTTAVAISGLPTDRFTFEGFVPRSESGRKKFFEDLKFETRTMVIFEAPHRLMETLEEAMNVLGGSREAVICREMTKTYEEIIRGTFKELNLWAGSKEILGEITIVISGASTDAKQATEQEIIAKVQEFEAVGMERKEAVAAVAKEMDLPKRQVFDAMIRAKKSQTES